MTSEKEEKPGLADQMLSGMVRDADEYYAKIKGQYVNQTRVHAAVIGAIVWFAVFAGLGVAVYLNIHGAAAVQDLVWAFLTAVVGGALTGGIMYLARRQKGFKFAELGLLLDKIKEHGASTEDGLRLMDAMHQAAVTVRKRRLDSALEYGIAAFILVSLVGLNAGFGALAGVVVYLYFRFEAVREYEREDAKYENSKKELVLSL